MKRNHLSIEKVSPEDNGAYKCLARNNAGSSSTSKSFPLIIPSNETATIKIVPQDIVVKRSEPASFSCVYENADNIQWFFKDIGPLDSDDEKTIMPNGTLKIHSAEHKDQGFYSCHGIKADSAPQIYSADLRIACKYFNYFFDYISKIYRRALLRNSLKFL